MSNSNDSSLPDGLMNLSSVVIANSGHWLPEEHPLEVIQHLTSFFAE